MEIIIRDGPKAAKLGRTRSQQETQLRKEWGPTLTDAQLDKCKYLEKQGNERYGSKDNFLPSDVIDDAKV